jgi:hypothetical protein
MVWHFIKPWLFGGSFDPDARLGVSENVGSTPFYPMVLLIRQSRF